MSECLCGYSTDYPNCNGTHKAIKKLKQDIIDKINDIDLEEDGFQLNAVGMRMLAIKAVDEI